MAGNLKDISELPLAEVAFSRLESLRVCADDQYVHGVQAAIKMHEIEE